ncbi:hypothetical protein [Allonocardiopsis opalescens]|uniref:Lipoprotein n=1 Tax=Allonocardiopsis opalescens TaxID=1144618 RepID=A0A2T0Q7X3_9ACTN|nr:hypothetical protein [Allonocardiopsis opalescens]PRX99947.1 hypothetical protein CLV72_103555 [Allonocardiopsis opalescens]
MQRAHARSTALAAAAALVLAGCGTGGPDTTGAPPSARPGPSGAAPLSAAPDSSAAAPSDSPSPSASPSADVTGDTQVWNLWRDESGRPQQAPAGLVLSEFSTLNELAWHGWQADTASGTGMLSGTWCLPECTEDPFPVEIVLGDPAPVEGTDYFTTYEITWQGAPPPGMEDGFDDGAHPGELLLPQ